MYTIIGSSERDCVLTVLFQLFGSKAKLFEDNLLWASQYDPLPPANLKIGRKTNPISI